MLTEPQWQVLNCSWRESFVEFRVNFRKKDWKFGFDLGLSLNPSFWVGKFSSKNDQTTLIEKIQIMSGSLNCWKYNIQIRLG